MSDFGGASYRWRWEGHAGMLPRELDLRRGMPLRYQGRCSSSYRTRIVHWHYCSTSTTLCCRHSVDVCAVLDGATGHAVKKDGTLRTNTCCQRIQYTRQLRAL